jgi:DNA-binding LacI/PurR family transcriptional regulator
MQRREFIRLVGCAAVTWPMAVNAQQAERVRRIGVLTGTSENNAEAQARHAAFLQRLQELGWSARGAICD